MIGMSEYFNWFKVFISSSQLCKLRTRHSEAQFSWQSGNLILINHQSLDWLSSNSGEMEISNSGLFSYSYLYRHYILILWIINNPYLSERVVSSNGIYKSQYICYYMLHPRGLTGCSCFVKINLGNRSKIYLCNMIERTWSSLQMRGGKETGTIDRIVTHSLFFTLF